MGDADFFARKATLNTILNNSQTQYDTYRQMVSAQQSSIRLQETLQAEKHRLTSELAMKKKDAEAYDREFLDRVRGGEAEPRRAASLGISTLQDWVLLMFYSMYVAATLAAALFIGLRAQQNKLVGVVSVLLGSAFLAVMFSMVIVRFA
jgi:hypothetical protein